MVSRQPLTPPVDLDRLRIPAHVAIIMDGNGRWAATRGLPRSAGHRAGREAIRRTIEVCRELGVRILTLYAFSTENWRRPPDEVEALLDLLRESLISEAEELHRTGIRLRISGDVGAMPPEIRREITRVVELTGANQAMVLNIALNYGGRDEIVRAARRLAQDVAAGRRSPESIEEATLRGSLDTGDLPDPDLLIRTGGERRLSNFLLWQAAYAELYFTDVYWPDFQRDHLIAAIADYQQRQRRFGGAPGE
ncbi:MAG: isoprenyl transferase [Armatimonadota bacterium]|nr:isoprenyl transferase [Armatimonadota bacterium]MDR7519459.1 isoprenyl transferase [Armatimonadota bacterium]MDR7550263.1 isoprenyl transferase [Armatimonadota bacterium]